MPTTAAQAKRTIQYPMAYRRPYRVTHIDKAEGQSHYLCLGCHQDMIPRKGRINKHHFAHKAGIQQCDPDNALHETAKAAICEGFLRALTEDDHYRVSIPCHRCNQPIGTNVALPGAAIATERSEVRGTRSDLVITTEDGKTPRLIVEVVVHHDLEDDTHKLYTASGIPIIKVRPSWETVDTLRDALHSPEYMNVRHSTCGQCRQQDALRSQWLSTTKAHVQKAINLNPQTRPRIEQIIKDKHGSFLRADTKQRVNRNARLLEKLGFLQQNSRPTLFKLQIPQWAIYADLDSTEVMRIWEVDCQPGLYAFPQEAEPPKCRECLLEFVRQILERHGIGVRHYFMDHSSHNHWIEHE